VHPGYEEFYVIEGEAVESDGTVIKVGDYISFPPNSYHNTRTDKGCLVLVFEWRP
jgi:quercetin dioxygenase-like cupin family protein